MMVEISAVLEKYMVAVDLVGEDGNVERLLNHVGLRFDDKFFKFVRSITTKNYRNNGLLSTIKCFYYCVNGKLLGDVSLSIALLICCIREEPALRDLDRDDFRNFLSAVGFVIVDREWFSELFELFRDMKGFDYTKVKFHLEK